MSLAELNVFLLGIDITGMGSADGPCDLGRRSLLTGDMGAGKSLRAKAARFAALGFVPPGRNEAATARFMVGKEMRVRVRLSDGRWYERALVREGQRLRSEAACSWLPEDTSVTEVGEAIRGLFGRTEEEAIECLYLDELMNATGSQRAARIEAMLDATALSKVEQEDWLASLPVFRLAKMEDERIPAKADDALGVSLSLLQTLDAAERGAFASAHGEARQVLQSKGASEALTHANRRKRDEADAVKRKKAARAEVEDRQAPAPAVTLDALSEQRQLRTDRLATLRAQVKAHNEAKSAREQAEQAAREAQSALDAVLAAGDPDTRASALREQAADLRRRAALLVDPEPVAAPLAVEPDGAKENQVADLEADAAALDAKAAAIEAVKAPKAPTLLPLPEVDGMQVERAQRDLEKARQSPWNEVRFIADQIDKFVGGTKPTDDSPAVAVLVLPQTKRLRTYADRHGGGSLADLEAAVTSARGALAKQEADKAAVQKVNDEASAAYSAAFGQWEFDQGTARGLRHDAGEKRKAATAIRDAEKARVARLNDEAQRRYRDACGTRKVEAERITAERARLTTEATKADEDAAALMLEWTKKAGAVAEAGAKVDGIAVAAPIDLDAASREERDLEAAVESIDAQRRAVQAADARRTELAALARELASAESAAKCWTAIEWALQRLREKDMAARATGLVSRMAMFLEAAGRPETPFLRAEKGRVDFGWIRNGAEIRIEALSGGESVLAMAALASAVIALRTPPVACLLLEANEVGSHIPSLLAGCEAVEDAIGTVLVCTNLEVADRAGWARVEIAAGAAVGV